MKYGEYWGKLVPITNNNLFVMDYWVNVEYDEDEHTCKVTDVNDIELYFMPPGGDATYCQLEMRTMKCVEAIIQTLMRDIEDDVCDHVDMINFEVAHA